MNNYGQTYAIYFNTSGNLKYGIYDDMTVLGGFENFFSIYEYFMAGKTE